MPKFLIPLLLAFLFLACAKKDRVLMVSEPAAPTLANDSQETFGEAAVKAAMRQMKYENNPNKALEIIEPASKEVDSLMAVFTEDSAGIYHYFENAIEEVIHLVYYEPKKTVRNLPENFFDVYIMHGIILFELGRYEDAITPLKKAMKINPISTDVIFELAEVYKVKKDWDEYLRLTREAHKVSYTKKDLARFYRNFGYYFIEQQKYDEATALYFVSLYFEPENKGAMNQLLYIQEKTEKQISKPDNNEVIAILKKNDIELRAKTEVLAAIYMLGKAMQSEGNTEAAKTYFSIISELGGED